MPRLRTALRVLLGLQAAGVGVGRGRRVSRAASNLKPHALAGAQERLAGAEAQLQEAQSDLDIVKVGAACCLGGQWCVASNGS